MQHCHLQQLSHPVIYITTYNILYMNIICNLHSDYMVLILKFYTVPMPFHDVKTFLNKRALSSKRVKFCYHKNMTSFLSYVTATQRALFAWHGSYIKDYIRSQIAGKFQTGQKVSYLCKMKLRMGTFKTVYSNYLDSTEFRGMIQMVKFYCVINKCCFVCRLLISNSYGVSHMTGTWTCGYYANNASYTLKEGQCM